jgi:uncharacterized protein YbaA (DUF1428 family)
MYLVRDIMYCKPGKVRSMVEKFQAIAKLGKDAGFGSMRVMTDVAAERYWTVISEVEVPSLEAHEATSKKMMADPKFQEAMKGYHDLVDGGRREIYTIEK